MPTVFPDPAALVPALDGLPAPWSLMALLLYVTFILHLLLMNSVVGVAVITLLSKLRVVPPVAPAALPEPHAPAVHGEHPPDLLLPKGVAFVVNFGIPPFLFMQCIYGEYIYSSSIQMAVWWLSVMLVVMLAYYGLYINMYRGGLGRGARTTALGISVCLLLWNAFLFVNNMTLLQNPVIWTAYADNASGTLLNTADPQLLPRYLHIVMASLAIGGLVLSIPPAWSLSRLTKNGGDPKDALPLLESKRKALRWYFFPTLGQILVGGWFLISLPEAQRDIFLGGDALATGLFATGLILVALSLVNAWGERAWLTLGGTLLIVVMMTGMRFLLRSSMLAPYYAPSMREFDPAPLLLFGGALVLSFAALFWLGRVYLRHKAAPGDHGSTQDETEWREENRHGDPQLLRKIAHMRKREALMVIELALNGKEEEEDSAPADESRGGAAS